MGNKVSKKELVRRLNELNDHFEEIQQQQKDKQDEIGKLNRLLDAQQQILPSCFIQQHQQQELDKLKNSYEEELATGDRASCF